MASHRLNPRYAIKECSTCGRLYTKECCSIGSLKDKILVPEPDSSPRCARCGTPVDGPSCRGCAFLRKKFDEDLLAYCVENGIFKDFQDTSESSDDNTNVVNALREPCVPSMALHMQHLVRQPLRGSSTTSRLSLKSTRCILNLTCNSTVADKENRFHLFYPLGQGNDSFSTFEIHRLALQEISLMEQMTSICDMVGQTMQKKGEERRIVVEQAAKEDMNIEEMRHEQQLVDYKIKDITNDLGYKRFQGEKIDEEYERDCEIRIRKLKQDFNEWGSEVQKKEQAYNEE
ncbi:hypothetical protein Tco_0848970 [Tanacetum coccineum]